LRKIHQEGQYDFREFNMESETTIDPKVLEAMQNDEFLTKLKQVEGRFFSRSENFIYYFFETIRVCSLLTICYLKTPSNNEARKEILIELAYLEYAIDTYLSGINEEQEIKRLNERKTELLRSFSKTPRKKGGPRPRRTKQHLLCCLKMLFESMGEPADRPTHIFHTSGEEEYRGNFLEFCMALNPLLKELSLNLGSSQNSIGKQICSVFKKIDFLNKYLTKQQ
jgi:hypothetical protein